MRPQNPHIDLLLQNLRRGFDQCSWHGPNLMGSIRGLTPDEAAWRPQPERLLSTVQSFDPAAL